MIDTVLIWTGVLVWGVIAGYLFVICIVLSCALIDFISKTIAAWRLIGKGRVALKPGWSRIGAAARWARTHLLIINCELHSGNDWLHSLYYSHPFKWRIVNNWDHIDSSDDEEAA